MSLDKLEDFYKSISHDDENSKLAKSVLEMQDWFLSLWSYDPSTNEPMPTDLDEVLYRISFKKYCLKNQAENQKVWYNDRLQKIIDYSAPAIYRLLEYFHEKQIREHLISRPEKIRQYDSEAIRYLSKKPGRTIKQKIAMNQYKVMGVFHNTSFDTLENRLFKTFIKKLDDILYEKEKAFGFASMSDYQKNFNSIIHRWLQEESAQSIGEWSNLPPNNTLLNDINYRKIWNAWTELIKLDVFCKMDVELYEDNQKVMDFWKRLAEINLHNGFSFQQQPIVPKIDLSTGYFYCEINTYLKDIHLKITEKNEKEIGNEIFSFNKDVKIDAIEFEKKYPQNTRQKFKLREPESQKSEIAVVDFVQIRPAFIKDNEKFGTLPVRMRYQFWKDFKNKDSKQIFDINNFYSTNIYDGKDIFSCQLKDFFRDDFLENFGQAQNNSSFSNFEKTNYCVKAANYFAKNLAKNLNVKNCIYLLPDNADDFSPVQKSIRNYMNINFQNASPLPRSIAAVFNELKKESKTFKTNTTIYLYDNNNDYIVKTRIDVKYDKTLEEKNPETKGMYFERHPCQVIKNKEKNSVANSVVINIGKDICEGALYLGKLQKITPEIPLWKDHLPLLYIKIPVNEKEKNFYLVGRNTPPIQPKKGIARPIEISENFTFPAGVDFYEFPLIQGEKQNVQKYYAYVANPAFPLQHDVECRLDLTYTYGEEIPYELKFISLDNEIKFVAKVRWETESHIKPWDLPAPSFIPETTWQELRRFPKRRMDDYGNAHSDIIGQWLPQQFDNISRYRSRSSRRPQTFRKSLRFPALSFWKFGRSIFDVECPKAFRELAKQGLKNAFDIYNREIQTIEDIEVREEMFYFLSCAAKDIPTPAARKIFLEFTSGILQDDTYKKSYAYALGDLSKEWQKELLEKILNSGVDDIDILYIISIAIWRTKEFVYQLSADRIQIILEKCLVELQTHGPETFRVIQITFVSYESIILEVMLGLLRARRTVEGKMVQNEEILKCLCPDFNPVIKKMSDAIKNAKQKRRFKLNTRIQFEGDTTLDNAVLEYLSSKKINHSIKITKVLDVD